MKKTLIALTLVASSIFLTSAQGFSGSIGINPQGQVSGGIGYGQNASNFATGGGVSQNVGGSLFNLIALVQGIVNRMVPLAIGLAVVSLFFGIVMYIWEGRSDGVKHDKWLRWMGASILALFVMVSIWGLVGFLGSVFGVAQGGGPNVPVIPTGPAQ